MGKTKLKAYAVFAGGGVKAIALAGALAAAQSDFVFVGYGGTSAGAIIALLAAAGYTGWELASLMNTEATFTQFLDDGGVNLETILRGIENARQAKGCRNKIYSLLGFYLKNRKLIHRIAEEDGIYPGVKAKAVLGSLIARNNPDLEDTQMPITFSSLRTLRRYARQDPPLLKVVATDIRKQRQIIFPNPHADEASSLSEPLIPAILASMSYPLLFSPQRYDGMVLVDGGVSSNLPISLFRDEQLKTGYPIIAFDLVDKRDWQVKEIFDRGKGVYKYPFIDFAIRLGSTALGSTDRTNRRDMDGVRYVRVPVTSDITLKAIPPKEQENLFGEGYEIAKDRLRDIYSSEMNAYDDRESSLRHVQKLLAGFIDRIVLKAKLRNCRAYIMLPTSRGTRRVEYRYKMDGHDDRNMEIGLDKGVTGAAWENRSPSVLDLNWIRNLKLTDEDRAEYGQLPPPSQQTIVTVPMYDFRGAGHTDRTSRLPLLGTLSMDTASDPETVGEHLEVITETAETWARTISMYLR